jgi:diguanylate cyclase (GGDEF)-like protein
VDEARPGGIGDGRYSDALLAELTSALITAPSGLGFVYDALDKIMVRWALRDAVLVLDGPASGRQVFRAGRKSLDDDWAASLAASADRGLYTSPVILHTDVAEGFVGLAEIALRMDILDHDATHDALTGLLNRRSFDTMLSQSLGRSRRYGWSFSLVMFDVNRFKALNDRLGHPAGDRVLRRIGAVLRSSLRAGDVAARIGGDEFAVLLSRGDLDAAMVLASRVSALVNTDLEWADIAFSVGVASAPAESVDAEELCRLADSRLYEAKAS